MNKRNYFLSVIIFLFFYGCSTKNESTLVGIQPFENFNPALTDTLKSAIEKYYGFKVVVFPKVNLPENAFTNIKSPRYRADSLLVFLKNNKPDSIDYILGVTNKDISVAKRDAQGNILKPIYFHSDYGIFGYGFRPGPTCIVSSFRLGNQHPLFISRLKKVALHELGHNLGLNHCPDKNCFMRAAEGKLKSIDEEKLQLCSSCWEEIH